ncbi:MAG: hypothetical protein LC117_08100 [Bacteroidia bacterium]|nr:hypothetical protein [Bacteroidia bacterium]
MKANHIIPVLFAVLIALVISCKKDKDEEKAGFGGSVSLILKPEHHGKPIANQTNYPDSVFLKFNQLEFPGNNVSDFDHVQIGNAGDDFVRVDGLKRGKYFIFATGFDTSITQRCFGGLGYEIAQDAGEIVLKIPITEGD